MIIVWVLDSDSNSIDVQLGHDDVVPDPRIMHGDDGEFSFSVKGRILTITRIDGYEGWEELWLHAYLPTEDIPDFTSTNYTYHGLDREQAP